MLRAETAVKIEKLRLFEQMGVTPPIDIATVQLTDTFAVQTPAWQLPDLLTMAEQQNPALKALRARERGRLSLDFAADSRRRCISSMARQSTASCAMAW